MPAASVRVKVTYARSPAARLAQRRGQKSPSALRAKPASGGPGGLPPREIPEAGRGPKVTVHREAESGTVPVYRALQRLRQPTRPPSRWILLHGALMAAL